ncbi:MAG: C1 family peptidase [Planctomycetota bacterium]
MPSAGGGSTGGGGGGGSSANLSGNPPLDFRLPNWPVRDQGDRGTCVAFATTACYEQFLGNAQLDLSEQFLYWAIKVPVGDGRPGQDGTWFDFARQALTSEGICAETLWPYSGVALPTNISRADANNPSQAAITDAATRLYGAALCQSNGNAATLYSTMQSRNRPVGISVPVFADPANQSNDNWNTTMGQVYGRIFDPPPTSVVVGGHAVCITGFEPDPLEQTGGWFIVRNSWGDQNWGASLPDPAHFGPEPGYGQISATYVDSFLWELFAM